MLQEKEIKNLAVIRNGFPVGFVIILSLIILFFIWNSFLKIDPSFTKGEEIINKIEEFREKNNRLPESLREIGIIETEEGPIYYSKESPENYTIWYGKSLGESATYHSDTKEWMGL